MKENVIYIKKMCCPGCKGYAEYVLKELKIPYVSMVKDKVHLEKKLTPPQIVALVAKLAECGLELMLKPNSCRIDQIKEELHYWLDSPEGYINENRSDYLANTINLGYRQIERIFRKAEGTTIEKYSIRYMVKRAEYMLLKTNNDIIDIFVQLKYKDKNLFYRHFKSVHGITPEEFRAAMS